MIDPFSPLFPAYRALAGDVPADPDSARAVMILGIIIILAIAFWAVGGMSAAVWVGLSRKRGRGGHSSARRPVKPSAS